MTYPKSKDGCLGLKETNYDIEILWCAILPDDIEQIESLA